jgi:hypothetical protein
VHGDNRKLRGTWKRKKIIKMVKSMMEMEKIEWGWGKDSNFILLKIFLHLSSSPARDTE